jgi:transposase-like protein
MRSGCITCSASACGMLSCFWLNVALSSLMRRFVGGARSLDRPSRATCDAAGHDLAIKWHLGKVFIRIEGVQHYLWRTVDQDGIVLDILVQPRRDAKAFKRFFRRLLKVPRVIVTDKLRSYGVAQRQLLPKIEHRQSRYLHNRAENSHRPTRR